MGGRELIWGSYCGEVMVVLGGDRTVHRGWATTAMNVAATLLSDLEGLLN